MSYPMTLPPISLPEMSSKTQAFLLAVANGCGCSPGAAIVRVLDVAAELAPVEPVQAAVASTAAAAAHVGGQA
jgi:hypothetical protein